MMCLFIMPKGPSPMYMGSLKGLGFLEGFLESRLLGFCIRSCYDDSG